MFTSQDQMIDHSFYTRVSVAVITDAVEEAKKGSQDARRWLESDGVDFWALGAGLEPDYVRRIVPEAFVIRKKPAKRTKRKHKDMGRTKEEREAARAAKEAEKAAKARAKALGLTRKQMIFVDAFRACGDVDKARFTARVGTTTVKAWLRNDKITALMYADE